MLCHIVLFVPQAPVDISTSLRVK